jgi:hypothetical protein
VSILTRIITLLVLLGLSTISFAQQAPTSQDFMQAAQDALQNTDFKTAILDYQQAIKLDPKNWEAYQNLGGCYIQLKQMDDAKAAYAQSLKLNPNNPSLTKFVAQVWGLNPVPSPTLPVPTPTMAAIASPTSTPVMGTMSNITPTFTPTYVYTVLNTPTPTVTGTATQVEVIVPMVEIPNNAAKPGAPLIPPFTGLKPFVYQALARYNLPEKNTLTMDIGGALWFGGVQNFNDYFGSQLTTAATSHTGWEVDLGADYAIVNEFQLGLHLEGLVSPVTKSQLADGEFGEWDSYALGLAAATKYLIPLNSAMSLIFHLEGGFYTLIGSQVTYNQGANGSLGLAGSALGFTPMVEMEFFQVADKSLALDFGLGYRFLDFTNLTGTGTLNGVAVSGPLMNANGKPAYDDYSGPRMSFSIRFVH